MHIFGEFTSSAYVGLFERLECATVQNLGMVDCEINIVGNRSCSIGAIAGESGGNEYSTISSGNSIISNCYADGNIALICQGDGYSGNVGGLIGSKYLGSVTIRECYSVCKISGLDNSEDESNILTLGGICGFGNAYGRGQTTIIQSYNMGEIKGSDSAEIGSVCGELYVDNYENCQYLKGTAQQGIGNIADNSNCVVLTEGQMKNEKLFTGYDFTDTWEIDPYCSYPYPQLKNNRMIRVKSVNLATAPSKLVYNQGETLSIDDSVLEVEYEDGIKTSIPLSLDMLGGYDMMQIGTQTVSVTYGGVETSFNIEVKEIPVSSITLPETLSIYRSKEQRLNPAILPANASDKSVTWESSVPSVASVDSNGLVKAMAKGTTVVTATSANGLQARCTVTVLVPAVSIQISQSSLTLKEGESKNITAQVLPLESTDTIKWRSGNAAVAEVYDGLIVAKKAGTAAITAYTDSGAQAICTVAVQNPVTTNTNSSGGSSGNSGTSANSGGNSGTSTGSSTADYASQIRKTQAAKAKISSAKNVKTKSIKLKLSGMSGYGGYQIQYGLKKNFKGAKSITKKSNSVTIKKLKAKKTYYVRVRVYKKIAGKTYYGKWSSKKSVKIKK